MYAVIRVGGRQERVKPGDVIEVDFMQVDPGSAVEFEPMVVFDDDGKAHVGKELAKAKVVARLIGDTRGEKIKVFKYRPKSGYRRSTGHRQKHTVLEIEGVGLDPGKMVTKEAAAAEAAGETEAAEAPAAKAPAAKKSPGKKAPAKKPATRKPAAKKTTAKKSATKKTTAKKTTAKKPTGRKKS
jgi:large subunit ribosomal protein L21